MKETIRVTNRFRGGSKEEIMKEVTKRIEKLINAENKRA